MASVHFIPLLFPPSFRMFNQPSFAKAVLSPVMKNSNIIIDLIFIMFLVSRRFGRLAQIFLFSFLSLRGTKQPHLQNQTLWLIVSEVASFLAMTYFVVTSISKSKPSHYRLLFFLLVENFEFLYYQMSQF